jgi:hypothetical protein
MRLARTRSGRSAAWLARLVRDQEVEGSNPFAPTTFSFPKVNKRKQHRPTLSGDEMTHVVAQASSRYKIGAALLAGSDVRISDCVVVVVDGALPNWFSRLLIDNTPRFYLPNPPFRQRAE